LVAAVLDSVGVVTDSGGLQERGSPAGRPARRFAGRPSGSRRCSTAGTCWPRTRRPRAPGGARGTAPFEADSVRRRARGRGVVATLVDQGPRWVR
jgi:hypothetical protein